MQNDFKKGHKITTVRWDDKNLAIFLNKTKEEVEKSFAVRLSVMVPVEFAINKGEFIGHESYLNADGEIYMENPFAEMQLLHQMLLG